MRTKAFASRNIKELLRDPISYIFCLGFPIIMLVIMSIINESIPDMPGTPTIFNIHKLTPAIAVFGLTFIMLFTCIQVSKDRSSALLVRLYTSPMKSIDYILGYTLPLAVVGIAQIVITFISGEIISLIGGTSFNIANSFVSLLVLIPSILLFVGIGLILGTIFNDKAAPGISSIFITMTAILGGIWMDIESMGDSWKTICEIFPFYHCVRSARYAFSGDFREMLISLLICSVFSVAIYIIAVFVFALKMKSDKK